jgi:hypothetical protein
LIQPNRAIRSWLTKLCRFLEHGPTVGGLDRPTVHFGPWGERGDGGVDGGGELVVDDAAKVGQRQEGQRSAAVAPGRPDHDRGLGEVPLGPVRVFGVCRRSDSS